MRLVVIFFLFSGLAHADSPDASQEALNLGLRQQAIAGSISSVLDWVRRGAQVNGQTSHGETALEYAIRFGRQGVARKLLAMGANPNLADDNGLTPLARAAGDCNASHVLGDMMKAGARVNHRDTYGRTALMHAARADCVRNVAVLILASKDEIQLDAQNDALETAQELARDGLVPLLIETARKYQRDGKEPLTIVRKQTLN